MFRRGRMAYLLAAAVLAAGLFLPAGAAPAQMNIFDKPAWEKDLRRIMWRHRSCAALKSYIWEVGDAEKIITRDYSLFGTPPSATDFAPLQDVSAFVFAAYVAERMDGKLSDDQISALTLRSGYNAPLSQSCNISTSVGSCFGNMGGEKSRTGTPGEFYYGPGHMQKLAMTLDLGPYRDGDMRDEYSGEMGAAPVHFYFNTLRVFDGLQMKPDNLSKFMRDVLGGKLRIRDLLGSHAVCLDPQSCAQTKVLYAPAPRTRDYSLGHWVEKNPETGAVEAYSMNGKTGIYVWISADKKYYGYVIPLDDGINRSSAGIGCGRAMYRTVVRATQARSTAP